MLQVKVPFQDYDCNQCNGDGHIKISEKGSEVCPKCFGTRKIDWVTFMKGDQPSIFNPADKDPAKMAETFKKLQEMSKEYNIPIMTITE